MKRIMASALAGFAAALGLVATTPTMASAAVTCRAEQYIRIVGGEAHVRECFSNGTQVRVNGWVKDTLGDGKCAQVYATYNNYSGRDYSPRACPEGNRDDFTMPWRAGTDAFIYLRVV
ncbi:hypothetical protein [Couchioplanes azureus]|uniref:hypothetical protein n=1 Tax=Couchioplanes caeruleus TaxID=56438 RepID=UPI0016702C45|nr:hypothetical protein [Couchioplanes caeruleus]GGQ70123.1 hypothetical protein GCM10010166_44960 [Couchioplanes caeruleus subsp. azureus]